jgi:hypothetical protein
MCEVAANCENTEELEMFGKVPENRLDVFPDYVNCFSLRCQGREVSDMVGDHHNTECGCDHCKRTDFAVTNSRIFPHLKRSSNHQAHQAKDGGLDKFPTSIFAGISARISEDGEEATQLLEANFSE